MRSNLMGDSSYGFEVLRTPIDIAYPISSDLPATAPFTRTFLAFGLAAANGVVQVALLVALGVNFEVRTQTFLLRERLAVT